MSSVSRRPWLGVLLALLCAGCETPSAPDEEQVTAGPSGATGTMAAWPTEQSELSFGVTPYLDRESVLSSLGPVLDHLSQKLGIPVRLVQADSYADLGARMQAQQIDVGKFSPLAYVEAKQSDPGLQVLLTQVAGGATSYLGYVYVRDDHPADSLAELAGSSFCYVDPQSASGWLYPRALLRKRGLDPDRLFRETIFGGNHLACVRKVLDGEVEAGAAFSAAFAAARHEGLSASRLKIVGKTARIPYDAYCARSGLPRDAAERFTQELLQLSTQTPDGKRLLEGAAKLNAFTQAQDGDYDSVREAARLAASTPQPRGPADEAAP